MLRAAASSLLRAVLGFYFRRLELAEPERVPAGGPLLVCANHPNSLADAMVLAALIPRPLHVVATAKLFRLKAAAAVLRALGVIAVNRASDDPRAMRSVTATFEAVYAVLERGGTVLIFPEGVTYDEPALRELKSGAARMALELEARHGGALGLKVLPVGLAYSDRGRYRGDALASAGEPLAAADFLAGYAEKRKECVSRLSAALDAAVKGLVVHQPDAARARVSAGVLRLLPSADGIEAARLRKRVADAVEAAFARRPEQAAAFAARLARYEAGLARLAVEDAAVRAWAGAGIGRRGMALRGLAAVVLGPPAAWGALHRWLPLALTAWAVERFADP
ncbi:MAG: 1-acyl-sn-glycerol-3-phosphate acyltransferase, partial [Elusimicrobia bacterium]|nr:1-acyl-sn-glycerol-3-phosphate acyltransferase [Elusimicrobiota bacterium]